MRQEASGIRATQTDRKTEIQRQVEWTDLSELGDLAAAFCSCFILMASSLTGLGMNVMSAPSFTSRPIHQSLLYFCTTVKHTFLTQELCCKMCWHHVQKSLFAYDVLILMLKVSHLFYVQEVFGFEVNSSTLDWTIFIKGPTVTHIGFHCKCYRFGLLTDKEIKKIKIRYMTTVYSVTLPLLT